MAERIADIFDSMGLHLLGCECQNRMWVLGVKRGGSSLVVFCPLCYAHSGDLIPAEPENRQKLIEAAAELDEEDSWGNKVLPSESNNGNGGLKN